MFKKLITWILGWLGRALDSTNLTVDVKLLAFFLLAMNGIILLYLEWYKRGVTQAFNDLFRIEAQLVGLGGTAWAVVERWSAPKSNPSPTPTPDAGNAVDPAQAVPPAGQIE